MDSMYKLLAFAEIHATAEAAVRQQAAWHRAIDPTDPVAQALEYQANRIHLRLWVREAEMRQFRIERTREIAQIFYRHVQAADGDTLFHANRIAGDARAEERAFEAERFAIAVRDRRVAQTIAEAARRYAELLLTKDPSDPTIEEIIYYANQIEGDAEQREKEATRGLPASR